MPACQSLSIAPCASATANKTTTCIYTCCATAAVRKEPKTTCSLLQRIHRAAQKSYQQSRQHTTITNQQNQALRDARLRMLAPPFFTPSDRSSPSLAHSDATASPAASGTGTAAAAATAALLTADTKPLWLPPPPPPPPLPPPAALKLLLALVMVVAYVAAVSALESGGSGLSCRMSTTTGCRTVADAAISSTSTITGSFQSNPSCEMGSPLPASPLPAAAVDADVDVAPAGAGAPAPAAVTAEGRKGSTPRCTSLLATCGHTQQQCGMQHANPRSTHGACSRVSVAFLVH